MLEFKTININRTIVETLLIPVCEDKEIHLGKAVLNLVKTAKEMDEFSGKKGEVLSLFNPENTRVKRAVFFGMGKLDAIDAESLRRFSGKAVKHGIKSNLTRVQFAAPSPAKLNLDAKVMFASMMEGAYLGNHIFDAYKKEKNTKPLKKIVFTASAGEMKKHANLPSKIESICRGTLLAREWVTTPSNHKRPETFAAMIQTAAKKAKLKVNILDDKQLKQKKFGALLSVSQGSTSKPRLVVLEYAPKKADKTIAFVGKGVTFDSGGISLKPSAGMASMKMDMSGAAVVAGTMISVAALKPKTRIVGIMPLVENMPSGSATRPGDIVTSFSGKTVEIGNTDAEGRLILIDAMAWAIKTYKPDTMIDLATLTGACIIALGESIAGVFSKDDNLSSQIADSGRDTGERCWPMPLPDDYKKLLKSEFADIHNMSSSKWGGAITAALFLSEFTEETRWAHIDIAGPSWLKKGSDYCGAGGTGFGVRLLCDLLDKL